MTEPKKTARAVLSEALSPKRDDHIDALSSALLQQSPWFSGHTTASIRDMSGPEMLANAQSNRWESNHIQGLRLTAFKDLYTKVRTDNLALTHEAAIELVKMIQREADLITYADIR